MAFMSITTINPETEDLMPLAEAARLPLLRKGAAMRILARYRAGPPIACAA
jgi:hypothetical protein